MKTLFLIRHGQAEEKGRKPDFDRNLDDEGRAEVLKTAREMSAQKLNPDLILSSPANRARQTAAIVADALGHDAANIAFDMDIYYTHVKELLEVLHRQDDGHSSILLAGHNPSISYLAEMLSSEIRDILPTGGMVAFRADTDTWANFEQSQPVLWVKIYP